jgi:propionate CoA-transferase
LALEQRFLLTGAPATSGWCLPSPRGTGRVAGWTGCATGLLGRAVGGHWALSPELGKMAVGNKIDAHNLPQGVVSQLFRTPPLSPAC